MKASIQHVAANPDGSAMLPYSPEDLRSLMEACYYPPAIISLVLAGAVLRTADGIFGPRSKVQRLLAIEAQTQAQQTCPHFSSIG